MIIVSTIKRGLLTVVVVACLLGVAGVGQAVAAEPWWRITTVSAPASKTGGESRIVVEVSNLGDAMVNGVAHPVSVVDELPVGVSASDVFGEGGGVIARSIHAEGTSCVIAGQSVSCTFSRPVQTYERLIVAIDVNVAPGAGEGVNEVSVSGGGPASVTSRRPLALSGSPSPFGVQSYELTPEEEGGALDTQAGSHPFQLTTTFVISPQAVPVFSYTLKETLTEVQPVALTKDLRFVLPPGLVGNPTPLPKCSLKTFTESSSTGSVHCPNDTVVGVVTTVSTSTFGFYIEHGPLAASWPLYALEPAVGEPAKFGFITLAGPVVLDTSVRTGGGYNIIVTVPNITELVGFFGSEVTFWGAPGNPAHDTSRGTCLDAAHSVSEALAGEASCSVSEEGQPLLILPTSCTGPMHTSLEADPWVSPGDFSAPKEYTFTNNEGEPYGQDGCNRLSFEPSIDVTPDGQAGSTPTGLTVDVHIPQGASLNPNGDAESTVKNTTVALPAGVALNPAAADGLMACSTEQLGLEDPTPISCPESSKVGTVEISTPLLPDPLVGAAYLAAQEANPFGSLFALYIVAEDPTAGVLVKFAGEIKADPVSGQLVTTFKETPQLPFEDLRLHFFGGERAPLGTPALCGAYTTSASIEPWSGNATAGVSSPPFEIISGPNGKACSDPLGFAPSLTAGSPNIQAAAFSPFTMTMSRENGQQNLQAIELHMPPGFLGQVSTVKQCGEAQANAGTCSSESLIGHTVVSVGLGGEPYTVTGGEVFFTGPYDGAPYGLSIVNPANAGPFHLGNIVVRAKIEVNPITAALSVTTNPSGPYAIPHIWKGIPLQIQHVEVSVDRPDFTFNPTDCEKHQITGSLRSDQGSSSALSVPYQVTNCAVLKFKPDFSVSTQGKTSRKQGASLTVKLSYPAGSFGRAANVAKVKVDLPKQLPSRLTTLQKACPDATFQANPAACPPDSIVGSAHATTPVLQGGYSGPAYFVSHGGAKFPELIVLLQGQGVTIQLHGETFISKEGITSSTFRQIPDVPIGAFELTLPQGTDSALAANGNLCTSKLLMPTAFVAQNGASIHQNTPIKATGCAKHKAKKTRGKRNTNKDGKR